MSIVTPDLLLKLNRPVPRYTSYPTAPEWGPLSPAVYAEKLATLNDQPISLYLHIPFCKTMCLYCGCSVVLNRKAENEERYVDYLIKEIDLIKSYLGEKKQVTQLHFGGGTPTKLSLLLMQRLCNHLFQAFEIDPKGEIAIEIDPRTVMEEEGAKLQWLKNYGFNRVSFGVQDTDPRVQEAVKRHQSLEMTIWTYTLARKLGFGGVNIDLIYGLPYQTPQSFSTTVSHVLAMRPDRIAFFSYAQIPWLKPHQKAIQDKSLPSLQEKFTIYAEARERFVQAGYVAIGMDHFALATDELAHAYQEKRLQRNFQGYSIRRAEEQIGLGMTAIGQVGRGYFQNLKGLEEYYQALDRGELPLHRGKLLSEEDLLRKWVIHTLMCDFSLDKEEFFSLFGREFDRHFDAELERLISLEGEGLVILQPEKIEVTALGELFIRVIAAYFDAYLVHEKSTPTFSQSV